MECVPISADEILTIVPPSEVQNVSQRAYHRELSTNLTWLHQWQDDLDNIVTNTITNTALSSAQQASEVQDSIPNPFQVRSRNNIGCRFTGVSSTFRFLLLMMQGT